LEPGPLTYAAPHRAVEELYDTATDPHQLHNLAADPARADVLQRLRTAHHRWMGETRDVGLLPEPAAWRILHRAPRGTDAPRSLYDWARAQPECPSLPLLLAAGQVGYPTDDILWKQELNSDDPAVGYWIVRAIGAPQSSRSAGENKALQAAFESHFPEVRIAAAESWARGRVNPAAALAIFKNELQDNLQSNRSEVALMAARALENLGPRARPLLPVVQVIVDRVREREAQGDDPCWMFVRFALEETLEQLAP
jgi:uncharacterized sulfatase